MARLGKPLAVAAFVLCVLFCGFAAAISAGGQNWDARRAELDEFSITRVGGGEQPVRFQVTDRVTTETVTTSDSLAAAVVAAYRERTNRLQAERQALQDRVDRMAAEAPLRTRLNKADRTAMDARLAFQQSEFERLTEELKAVTAEGARLVDQAEQLRSEAATRAEDADRLASELDAIRTDLYRVLEQIAALKDRKVRLEGALARAERRRQQLTERLE
ncbi:hypothetical protein [Alienimonas californiensis]|uniref:Chromosome partition protein Smc n=1 Tax=Alienimonas californiensis TaxID=2527989 RepID=A0A517PC13_9PLAN|nr:hypothetical protein [Alienimonas californiensis]QDT16899.1 Chromosome partition protein Smc [Alienimonas californiensis]